MQNIWNFIDRKSNLQENANFAIIREISDSNLETGRSGSKSGASRIIQENWQHWVSHQVWAWWPCALAFLEVTGAFLILKNVHKDILLFKKQTKLLKFGYKFWLPES